MNNSSAQTNTLAPPLDIELFRRLSEADGPSGFEGEIREILRHRFAEAGGEILEDRLGGVIGVRRGTADRPRIMLDCHTDEVDFIVRHITKDGFLRFLPLGSWPGDVLSAERVRVMASGGKISGMIGAIPPHHRTGKTALPALESLYIDIGAESRDQVESWGIRIGTPIVPATPFQLMRNPRRALGKAFDNRAGCALCVEAFQRAAGFAGTLYAAGSAQEEVGVRGAETTAATIDPDLAIVFEGPPADDTPGFRREESQGALGQGPQIRVIDRTAIIDPRLIERAIALARAAGIPFQLAARASGGTDAKAIHLHGRGTPTLVIGVPVRYAHSAAGCIDLGDCESALRLGLLLIDQLSRE